MAVAALLSAPVAALAQSAQTPGAAPSAPAAEAGKAAPAGGAAARVEQRIKELRAQLKITPPEETQWRQFAQTMRDNAREMDQALMQRAEQFPNMNAVQDMEPYEKIAEAHLRRLEKLIPAFQNLYAAMSPEQKSRADEVFRANRSQTGSSVAR